MKLEYVLKGEQIQKKFKGFELNIPELKIPKGFATALIGENGAGKSTLLNIIMGTQLQHKGQITYFNQFSEKDREDRPEVKERIGYTGPGTYYLPQWKMNQLENIYSLLFENFHPEKFKEYRRELAIGSADGEKNKKVSELSDGNLMKLMIAGALSRDTELLIMDEPASPLDPLMREKLCELIREYLNEQEGERTVFFSTHNISDMENVTDYAIILANGSILEEGFVEDLKEKYVLVKGETEDLEVARKVLMSISSNKYGFEGMCLAEDVNRLAGCDVTFETPDLSQISVAVMKTATRLK